MTAGPGAQGFRRETGVRALALGLLILLAACSAGPPEAPQSSAGTVETRDIPAALRSLPLQDQSGSTVALSSFRGKTIMLVPFLTLCSETCPLATGNLLQVVHSLKAVGLGDRVEIVEMSVDPERDTEPRLAAYARLTGSTWELVTESAGDLARLSGFFGFFYQRVPEGNPPDLDWWTGKPLTYDVDHSDGYVLIGPDGKERFSTGAGPDFSGQLNPELHRFLSTQGRTHLAHPAQPGWTPRDALASIGWLLGRSVPYHPE